MVFSPQISSLKFDILHSFPTCFMRAIHCGHPIIIQITCQISRLTATKNKIFSDNQPCNKTFRKTVPASIIRVDGCRGSQLMTTTRCQKAEVSTSSSQEPVTGSPPLRYSQSSRFPSCSEQNILCTQPLSLKLLLQTPPSFNYHTTESEK